MRNVWRTLSYVVRMHVKQKFIVQPFGYFFPLRPGAVKHNESSMSWSVYVSLDDWVTKLGFCCRHKRDIFCLFLQSAKELDYLIRESTQKVNMQIIFGSRKYFCWLERKRHGISSLTLPAQLFFRLLNFGADRPCLNREDLYWACAACW